MTRPIAVSVITAVILSLQINLCHGRTWTNRKGETVEADFIGFANGKVQVRRKSDAKVFAVPLELLSDADQAFVKAQANVERDKSAAQPENTDAITAEEAVKKVGQECVVKMKVATSGTLVTGLTILCNVEQTVPGMVSVTTLSNRTFPRMGTDGLLIRLPPDIKRKLAENGVKGFVGAVVQITGKVTLSKVTNPINRRESEVPSIEVKKTEQIVVVENKE